MAMKPWRQQLIGSLLSFLLTIAASQSALSQVVVDAGERYHTAEMIIRTVQALPECLEYCVLGIELRVKITPTSIKYYFVPRVEHHMVSLHVMTSDEFPKEAYIEWAEIFGVVQKWMLDGLARALAIADSNGHQTRYSQFGRHQATVFKETELMGNPVAILPSLLDGTGHITVPSEYLSDGIATTLSSVDSGQIVGRFITQWIEWAKQCFMDPLGCALAQPGFPSQFLSQFFSIAEAIETLIEALEAIKGVLDFIKMAETIRQIAEEIGSDFGVGGGVRMDRLLCPNDILYFFPYYGLSTHFQ